MIGLIDLFFVRKNEKQDSGGIPYKANTAHYSTP